MSGAIPAAVVIRDETYRRGAYINDLSSVQYSPLESSSCTREKSVSGEFANHQFESVDKVDIHSQMLMEQINVTV